MLIRTDKKIKKAQRCDKRKKKAKKINTRMVKTTLRGVQTSRKTIGGKLPPHAEGSIRRRLVHHEKLTRREEEGGIFKDL